MPEIYTLSEDSIRKLGRMLHDQQRELTNLRRRLASVSVRRHEAVYMPAPMGGGMLYLGTQTVSLDAALSEETTLYTDYRSGQGSGYSAAALTERYVLDANTDQLKILKQGWWLIHHRAELTENDVPGPGKSQSDIWIVTLDTYDSAGVEKGYTGQYTSGQVLFFNDGTTSGVWKNFDTSHGHAFIALDAGDRLGLSIQHFYGGSTARNSLNVAKCILTAQFVCKA